MILGVSEAPARVAAGAPERLIDPGNMHKSPLNNLQGSCWQQECLAQQAESSLQPQFVCLAVSQALPAAEKQGPAAGILSPDLNQNLCSAASRTMPAAEMHCPAAKISSPGLKSAASNRKAMPSSQNPLSGPQILCPAASRTMLKAEMHCPAAKISSPGL